MNEDNSFCDDDEPIDKDHRIMLLTVALASLSGYASTAELVADNKTWLEGLARRVEHADKILDAGDV